MYSVLRALKFIGTIMDDDDVVSNCVEISITSESIV